MCHPRRSFCRLLLGWLRWLPVLLLLLLPGLPLPEVEAQAGGLEPGATSRGAAHVEQPLTVPLTQPDVGAEAVSVGRSHACVLLRNGEVLCYETSTWERSAVPANVGPVSQISVGFNHTCAITNSGTVRCWGSNGYGQAEVPPDLGPVSQVSAGTEGTCVLLTDGTVRCWGIRVTYQPNVPPDLGPVSQVSANVTINESGATCVVTNAGTVRCWGNILELEEMFIPTDLGPVSQISTGGNHACTVNAQGQVRCWGMNSYGQAEVPPNLGPVSQVSAGFQHTCAVTTDGSVRCWGSDSTGQSRVPPDLGPVSQVSAGFQHTCAVTTDGAVRCWGDNNRGQLVSGIEGGRPVGDSDSDVAVPTLPAPDTPSAIVSSGLVYSSGQRQYLVDLTNNLSVPFYPAPPRGSIRGPGDTWLWIEMDEKTVSSWFRIVQSQHDSTDPKILLESTTFYQYFPSYSSPTFDYYNGIFLPEPVLSADATRVFFIACLEGTMGEFAACDFFELDLATRNVTMVAEFEGDVYPAWINPDGQRAIYTLDLACMGTLHVRRNRTALSGTPFSAVWLADKRFVYSRHICNGFWTPLDHHVEPQFDIILASANGSDERVLVPGMVASSMALDPDQQTLAFITARPGVKPAGDVALWVVNLDGSGLRKVLDLPDDAVDLRWEVPTEEQQRRLVAPPPLPTQGEIAYVQEGNIYLLDLARWEATPLVTDGTVEATGTFQRTQLAWSPDGKRLAYASNRAGNYDIYVLDVESGAVEQITTDPRDESVPSFAPDGTLFFVRVIDPFMGGPHGKEGENHVIRVTDDGVEEVVTALPCILYSLSIDANGLLAVADACNLVHGTVSVVDPTAPKEDFAHLVYYFDGVCSGLRMYRASDSKWSRDGATLAVIGADCFPGHGSGQQQAIFLVDPTRPEVAPRRILSDQGWLRGLDWSPDGEWLVYANSPIFRGESDEGIWIVNIEGGRPYQVVASGNNPAWRPILPDRASPLAPSAAPATSSAEPILPDNWWPLSPPLSYLVLALGVVVLTAGGFVVGWAGVAWMSSSRGGRTAHVGPTRRLSNVARTRRIRGNSGPRRWYWLAGLIGGAVVLMIVVFMIGWPFGAAADEELTEPTAATAEPADDMPKMISAPPIATDPASAPTAAGPVILPMPPAAPPPTPAMVEVPAPSLLSRSAWGARDARSGMLQHTPARIIVSHDTQACCTNVTPATRMRENQSRHMDSQGWPDIAYHYSIAPDGTILIGRAVELQGDSAYAPVNPTYQVNGAIVLGMLGNYDQQHPTAESLRAVTWLMAWLCQRYGIAPDEIAYLRHVAPVDPWRGETTSPGRNMPDVAELRDAVQAILVGERQP